MYRVTNIVFLLWLASVLAGCQFIKEAFDTSYQSELVIDKQFDALYVALEPTDAHAATDEGEAHSGNAQPDMHEDTDMPVSDESGMHEPGTDDGHSVAENGHADEAEHDTASGQPDNNSHGVVSQPPQDAQPQHPSGNSVVAVVAAVDSLALLQTGEEGEEQDTEALNEAMRRERDVRQGISKRLLDNTLIDVKQPTKEQSEQARQEIIANNSPALSAALAMSLGKEMGVDFVVCALIDDAGHTVNIAASNVHTGQLVFQDALKDWSVAIGTAKEETEE